MMHTSKILKDSLFIKYIIVNKFHFGKLLEKEPTKLLLKHLSLKANVKFELLNF